jgi:hypothetical protein
MRGLASLLVLMLFTRRLPWVILCPRPSVYSLKFFNRAIGEGGHDAESWIWRPTTCSLPQLCWRSTTHRLPRNGGGLSTLGPTTHWQQAWARRPSQFSVGEEAREVGARWGWRKDSAGARKIGAVLSAKQKCPEGIASRGSNEVASCLMKHLKEMNSYSFSRQYSLLQ